MSALEEVDLSYNQLQSLPRGILSNNTKLKVLDLSNNKFQRLPEGVFGNLTRMKRLFVSNNKLQRLPKLTNLSEIETLYMEKNSLVTLSPDQFQGLSKLKDLAVYENNIQYLPPGVFKGLKNMQSMSFYSNKIQSVSNEQFKDIAPSIRFLYFHYNEMRELPAGFFSNMKYLITATVDTNLMCCYLKKEDADCGFAYVDSFASCETMFRDRAPRICLWVVGIVSLIGALFVIVWRLVFKETKQKNKIQSIMLIYLAGSDGLMGVYLIIIGVVDAIWAGQYFLHDYYWRSSLPCQMTGSLSVLSSEVSLMLICLLSADRLKNILYPHSGKSLTIRVTHFLCFLIWIVGGMIAFIPTVGINYFGSRQKGHHFYGRSVVCLPLQFSADQHSGWEYSVAMFVGLNSALVFFVTVAYSMIIYKSCASNRRLAQQGTERERRMKANQRAANLKREASLAKRVFFIVLTDCVCWLPIVVIGARSLLEKSFRVRGDLAVWIAVFVLPVNSAINPFLYTLSTPQVRGVIKAKLQPLWDYLMAKLARNQNVEAQDQGMAMRVIEEVQNHEEMGSADDSEEELQEEQGEREQHAGLGEGNGEPTEPQCSAVEQVYPEQDEESEQGQDEPAEQQQVEREQDGEPKQGQDGITEQQQVERKQDEEPKQDQNKASEQEQVESKRGKAPKYDHEEPTTKQEVERDHSKGNKEVSEQQPDDQELKEGDEKPVREQVETGKEKPKGKGDGQESKQQRNQQGKEKELKADHRLKDGAKKDEKSKGNKKESEQQQEENEQDEQEQEKKQEESENQQVEPDQEGRENYHKGPKHEEIKQEKPRGEYEDPNQVKLQDEKSKGDEEDSQQRGEESKEDESPRHQQLIMGQEQDGEDDMVLDTRV